MWTGSWLKSQFSVQKRHFTQCFSTITEHFNLLLTLGWQIKPNLSEKQTTTSHTLFEDKWTAICHQEAKPLDSIFQLFISCVCGWHHASDVNRRHWDNTNIPQHSGDLMGCWRLTMMSECYKNTGTEHYNIWIAGLSHSHCSLLLCTIVSFKLGLLKFIRK